MSALLYRDSFTVMKNAAATEQHIKFAQLTRFSVNTWCICIIIITVMYFAIQTQQYHIRPGDQTWNYCLLGTYSIMSKERLLTKKKMEEHHCGLLLSEDSIKILLKMKAKYAWKIITVYCIWNINVILS